VGGAGGGMPDNGVPVMRRSSVPPRQGLGDRLRLQAGYRWRNSGNPLLVRLRVAWDMRRRRVMPSVRSELGGISVSYSGLPEGLAYTLEFTELRRESGGEVAARSSGTITGRQLASGVAALPDADIVIVGTSAKAAHRLPGTASLVLPMRVHFVADIDSDPETIRRRISERERWQFSRNARRYGWSWQTVTDPAWFDVFYDNFYRPTMRERHGARERTEAKESSYECLFRNGHLFALCENGERIAGTLCHWDQRSHVLTLRLLGVRDGSAEYLDRGALKAVYHYLTAWSANNNVRQLDLQGTESFLSKGTYQWKRRLGTRVILPPNHFGSKRLWLHVRRDTPGVRDFLTANPVLAESADGTLAAVYFCDAHRPPRLDYSAKSPGVSGSRLADLDDFLSPVLADSTKGLAK
jgi:hypothetical protein